jgi:hypothetical protein
MRVRWNDAAGRWQLWQAVVLERRVAGRAAKARLILRRNLALVAAAERGVEVGVMARRLGLQPETIARLIDDPTGEVAKAKKAEKAARLKPVPPLEDEQLPDAG